MTIAGDIARKAAELVDGDRAGTHGDKLDNHCDIASLWTAYLGKRLRSILGAKDVALMLALLKIARTKSGAHNPDDYLDGAGYMAVAGEIAERVDSYNKGVS